MHSHDNVLDADQLAQVSGGACAPSAWYYIGEFCANTYQSAVSATTDAIEAVVGFFD